MCWNQSNVIMRVPSCAAAEMFESNDYTGILTVDGHKAFNSNNRIFLL